MSTNWYDKSDCRERNSSTRGRLNLAVCGNPLRAHGTRQRFSTVSKTTLGLGNPQETKKRSELDPEGLVGRARVSPVLRC